ncbi:uncharacterized protein At4g00950-like [Bidens hawaiensis]|uniref:uncharacterized protein At4g00950-like n=1 Tax=Bidens hawaiensis TaxID=980011 RepID=UPI00404AEC17
MGSDSEPESDPYHIPKLPLFSIPHYDVTEPSSMPTPPRQTLASVPFQWEEQPGKPHPFTDIIISSNHTKCLELPPRLAVITKISSPTTVLDGPGGGRSVFSSASFRFYNNNNNNNKKERRRRRQMQGSFDSSCSGGWSPTEDNNNNNNNNNNNIGLLQPELSDNKVVGSGRYKQFGSFRIYKPKGSIVISPSSDSVDAGFADETNNNNKMRRNSSLSKVTRSDFWAKIYQGFKQVVPWKKKTKKEIFTF